MNCLRRVSFKPAVTIRVSREALVLLLGIALTLGLCRPAIAQINQQREEQQREQQAREQQQREEQQREQQAREQQQREEQQREQQSREQRQREEQQREQQSREQQQREQQQREQQSREQQQREEQQREQQAREQQQREQQQREQQAREQQQREEQQREQQAREQQQREEQQREQRAREQQQREEQQREQQAREQQQREEQQREQQAREANEREQQAREQQQRERAQREQREQQQQLGAASKASPAAPSTNSSAISSNAEANHTKPISQPKPKAAPAEKGAANCKDKGQPCPAVSGPKTAAPAKNAPAAALACPAGQVWNGVQCALPGAQQCLPGQSMASASCQAACTLASGGAQNYIQLLRMARQDKDEACTKNPTGTECQLAESSYSIRLNEYRNYLGGVPSQCILPDPISI